MHLIATLFLLPPGSGNLWPGEMVGPRRAVDESIRLDLEFSTLGLAWKLTVFEQLDLEIQAMTNGLEVRTAHVFLGSHKSS